jgi:hypothetical protein
VRSIRDDRAAPRIRRQIDARCYLLPDRRCFNSLFWQLADRREVRLKPALLRKPRQSVGKWLGRNGHQRVAGRALGAALMRADGVLC